MAAYLLALQERRDVMEREEEARQARQDAERAKKGHRASLDGVKRELHKLQVGGAAAAAAAAPLLLLLALLPS